MSKKIILGVSGSIAAYKSLQLVRLLVKSGHEVKVIMTDAATHFVSALSFATLSRHDVSTQLIDNDTWNNHVDLGLWADAMIIAPATATTLSKLANGLCDNMLVATYLSAKCPVYIAPAMDLDMWKHPSTWDNIKKLVSYGNQVIPVGHGELASGLIGAGRMAEPEDIVDFLHESLQSVHDLADKKVLITAGPTRESFDPVRFIGNNSTGKMGIELAEECASRGAEVTIVLGPTHLQPTNNDIKVINVISAQDMYEAVIKSYGHTDVTILAAAVADYRPATQSDSKIKKKEGDLSISLVRTIDIAESIGKIKKNHQVNIGFALETNNEMANAKRKLVKKNLDFIVLNSLNDKGAGFAHNTNKVSIVHKDDNVIEYELKSKREVSKDIVNEIVSILK